MSKPLEEKEIFADFRIACKKWYSWGTRHRNCCEARQVAYRELIKKWSFAIVIKHVKQTKALLDQIEQKVKTETAHE